MNNSISIEWTVKLMYVSHIVKVNDITISQDLESLVISYAINQSVDPQLWDGNFYPISFFRMNML